MLLLICCYFSGQLLSSDWLSVHTVLDQSEVDEWASAVEGVGVPRPTKNTLLDSKALAGESFLAGTATSVTSSFFCFSIPPH